MNEYIPVLIKVFLIFAGSFIIYLFPFLMLRKKHFKGGKGISLNLLMVSLYPIVVIILVYILKSIQTPYFTPFTLKISLHTGIYLLIFLFTAQIIKETIPVSTARKTIRWVLLPLLFSIGLLYEFNLLKSVIHFLQRPIIHISGVKISIVSIIVGVIFFFVFLKFAGWLKNFLEKKLPGVGNYDTTIAHTVAITTFYTIIFIGSLISLSIMGIDLTTLKIIGGALGVGIGFGLQSIVNNFVSGFILLWERTIKRGDVIEVNNHLGRVERIGLRATSIRTFNNIELIIPNAFFINNSVINYTHSDNLVMVGVPVGVPYGSDPYNVKNTLLDAVKGMKDILEHPEPMVLFNNYGESSLNFELKFWISQPLKKLFYESEIRFLIFKKLKDNGIEIPFPQMDVHLKNEKDNGIDGKTN